jgi:hypothetical protein
MKIYINLAGVFFIGSMIKRAFLYQFLIFFAVFRLLEAFRFHKDFQTKLFELFESLHLNKKILNHLPKDTEILYKVFLITLIVLSSFSILGIKFFQFISGLACFFIGFLYHNPIQDFKQLLKLKEKITVDNIQNYLPSIDFIIFVCIGFGMIAHSFKSTTKNKKPEDIPSKPKNVNIEMPIVKEKKKKKE